MIMSSSFRPQQGLAIMNMKPQAVTSHYLMFPSPTGVSYHESEIHQGF